MPTPQEDWSGHVADRHSTGSHPFDLLPRGEGQAGYDANGKDHYDPILTTIQAEEYCQRIGSGPQDWSTEIQNAITEYRDRYLILDGGAAGGIPGHHYYTHGMVRHWQRTGDAADVSTIDLMAELDNGFIPVAEYESYWRTRYDTVGFQRELSYWTAGMIDREAVGLEPHGYTHIACEVLLGFVDHFIRPPEERYGVINRPFFAGVHLRTLIYYWFTYRDSAIPAAVANVAAIPAAVLAYCDFLWENCWYPAGTPAPSDEEATGSTTWDKGGIKYVSPSGRDPSVARIDGLEVVTKVSELVFTGPASLSTVDGFYVNNRIEVDGVPNTHDDHENRVSAYVGSTRQFTVRLQFGSLPIEAGDTFSICPQEGSNGTGLPGDAGLATDFCAPALNGLLAHAYAWLCWYHSFVLDDPAGAAVHRARHEAMFDGQSMCYVAAWSHKEWNQALLMGPVGLAWRDAADAGEDTQFDAVLPSGGGSGETTHVLLIPVAGGNVLMIPQGGG